MFGVYEISAHFTNPVDFIINQRAHFTTEFLAREWAELKAKKEHTNVSFVVIDLSNGTVVSTSQGARAIKVYENKEPANVLPGKVDLQA